MTRGQGDRFELSNEAVARIRAEIDERHPFSETLLHEIASNYREWVRRRASRTGRGFKADLKALSCAVAAARTSIDAISLEMLAAIAVGCRVAVRPSSLPSLQPLKHDLASLQLAIDSYLELLAKPVRDRTQSELPLTLLLLSVVYRRATGRPVTHNANRDGRHTGEPLSPFGRFARAFFSEVDPKVTPTRLAGAIRRELPYLNEPLPG